MHSRQKGAMVGGAPQWATPTCAIRLPKGPAGFPGAALSWGPGGRGEGSAACPEAAVVSHIGRQACRRQWPGMESLG